ncbi:hypothetical protein ABBQ38_002284 [Trebouxia sp. C0009 RCD-2024]
MITWCSAGLRLSTAVRVAISSVRGRSAVGRPQPVFRALQTRAPVICAAAPPTKLKARKSAQSSSPSQVPKKATQDSFYAPEAVTFKSLGASVAVTEALQHAGFTKPSTVQELALPVLLKGDNAVLAAETGSGKTICYLVPVISRLLDSKQGLSSEQREGAITPGALVLCPNAALCQQVKLVADSLTDSGGLPLLQTAHVSSSSPPPFKVPDILVSTPASLINVTQASHYGPEWTRGGILSRMHHVVLDEADLLLGGGFERDVGRILEGMKQNDKERKAQCLSQELGMPLQDFQALPRHIKNAACEGGVQAMLEVGYERPSAPPHEPEDDILQPSTSTSDPAPADRQFERQYIFVAATLPSEGKKSTASSLQKMFPDLVWLAGRRLHQGLSTVAWTWRETTQDTWRSALQEAVTGRQPPQGYAERVLVFAETVAAANGVSNALEAVGVTALLYHKGISASDRAAALATMSKRGGVMVSTDAAARGIDIPNVTHVIQADFAASAVDFLHRVGRTARQGQSGQVTSLYSPDRKPLAEAVKAAIEADLPVEGAFSRNRSFSKKFKKYGQYVPRGQNLSGYTDAATLTE